MVGGHVIGCRRTSQQHHIQTYEEKRETKKKASEIFEEDSLASANEKISKIKIASLNAYNLISRKKHKVKQIEALLREENIKILCLQETWMNEEILDTEIHIDEFRIYRQDRGGIRKGGGVLTYIDTSLTVTHEESYTNGVCDVIYTEIEDLNIAVINAYRPPSSDKESFNEILQKAREWTGQTQREIVLLGDLNFKSMNAWTESDKDGLREDIVGKKKTHWGRELAQAVDLLEFIEDNGLIQWVTDETRKDSILDLVFTNSTSMRGTEVIKNSVEFSDHNTVISTFLTARKEEKGEPPVNYHKSDLPLYKIEELEEEDWSRINKILFNQSWTGIAEMTADELQELIVNRYVEAIDAVAEKKTTKKAKKRTPIHLRGFIRAKRKAGKKLRNSKKLTENQIKEITRKIWIADLGMQNAARFKQEQEEKKAYTKIKSQAKLFYSYARKISNNRNPIGPFVKDGSVIRQEPASVLNEHYCSVFSKEEGDKLPDDYAWSIDDLPKDIEWISDLKFSVKDVSRIIKKISSTAAGPSGISPLLLKKTEQTMSPIVWRWCRTVIDSGMLPNINTLSIINPLLKPGKSAGDPASYRPVALTELLVRVLEKLIHNVMERHAEKHGLFGDEQHGFRKRHSTISNILRCQQRLLEERSRGKTVDTVFLDLSKAFDKVPTKMLVKRLKNCGYRGKILQFCRNFLEGRRQYTIANGRASEERDVTSGTPQGGCLSPLFFLLYISPLVAMLNTYSNNDDKQQEKTK